MGYKMQRQLAEDLAYHVWIQCNNKEFRFQNEADFLLYLSIIKEVKEKHNFLLYDYGLMHTHVHLFLRTPGPSLLDTIMWHINRTFSVRYNKRNGRCGHIWMGPYKASVVDNDQYGISLLRYLPQNAPQAGIVQHPDQWKWCGYRFYAYGEPNELLTPAPTYLELADRPEVRQKFYRHLVSTLVPKALSEEEKWLLTKLKRWQIAVPPPTR
ncbi:MAG: transposase [Deltaproteobacteria bacterium]|nr:transposase [Deltaproteobacteria bacterium]